MGTVSCECLSCGHIFEVEQDDLRAGKKISCPNCDYEHCLPEGARKKEFRQGPIPVQGRSPYTGYSFWPRH